MSRRQWTFRQSDLTRALKGAKAAGVDVARVKIANDGTIQIDTDKTPQESLDNCEWDAAVK